jgi:stage IV sporulation protein A
MEGYDIFADIAQRTGGEIYVGVVGPVRTGKSTLIKRFMELLVLPNITDPYDRERTMDELPQSGAGRTVMTTEPKFIPDEGVAITIGGNLNLRVRFVDCVGFPVPGALGYREDSGPRMVVTPWFDYEIPFEEAAEVGTRKVIADHAVLGLVVTADGSFGELARDSFVAAEEKAVAALQEIGKPFVVVLNSARPDAPDTDQLVAAMREKYGVPVVPANCAQLDEAGIERIMEEVLYEFPVREVNIQQPGWVLELPADHWLRRRFEQAAAETLEGVRRLRDVQPALHRLAGYDVVERVDLLRMDMGSGVADIALSAREEVFQQVLQEITGVDVSEKANMVRLLRELVAAKQDYDRVADALREVRQVGYAMVAPDLADMTFEDPELVRRGSQFGVRLRARAPSLHLFRADVEAEYTPILGTERQSEDLVRYLMEKFEDDPQKIWDSQIFGRTLNDVLREGIRQKLQHVPESAQQKLAETLQRIINEGSGGLICILL